MEGLSIKHCIIFNPKLKSPKKKPSDDEIQDAKLLFYYPFEEELIVKRSNIGIIEGSLSIMNSFEQTNTSFLLTELDNYYYLANNYENDFIITFIIEKQSNKYSVYENLETKKKWLKKILDMYYNIFTFFHHSFTKFFLNAETPEISPVLSKDQISIFSDFTLNFIDYCSNRQKLPFVDNVVYFPLNEHLQSDILLAVQRLNEKIPEMAMSTILYKGNIIHNQIPLSSFSAIYNVFYSAFDLTPKFQDFKQTDFEEIKSMYLNNIPNKETNESTNTLNDIQNLINQAKDVIAPKEVEEHKKLSNFRKSFPFNPNKDEFLIGYRPENVNNYQIFIPTVHINQLDENYKLLVYHYKGMLMFIFLNEDFSVSNKISSVLMKIDGWVDKYFKELIPLLEEIYKKKVSQNESICYAYCNNANKSVKLSSYFFNKKTRLIEQDRFDNLQKMFYLNDDVNLTALSKVKGHYYYYINCCERNVLMIYEGGVNVKELKKTIEENKKELFDSVYII